MADATNAVGPPADEVSFAERRPSSFVDLVLFVAAVPAIVAALVVAVGGFTWGLPGASHVQSYHPDEQNITYSLRNMNPRDFDFNPRFFGNPTFFTYQVGGLALASSALGVLPREMSKDYWLSHPEAVRRFYVLGRALSFVYACLAVLLIYILTKRITSSNRAAFIAAAVFVSLPVTAVHSHYMTVNASAVFWSLLAILYCVKICDRPSWPNYVLAALFAGLAVSTKMNNLFLPIAILVAHLSAEGQTPPWRRLFQSRIWAAAAVFSAAFFAGSPYYLLSYRSVRANPHNQMNIRAVIDFSTPLATVLRDFANHMTASCGWGFAVLLVAALPAVFFLKNKRLRPLVAIALPFFLLGAKSGWWAFPSRLWPLLALLVIFLCVLADASRAAFRVPVSLLVALGLFATVPWNVAYARLIRGPHVREASSRWIESNIPAASSIIVLDTPYFDDPDVVYENALHAGRAEVKYDVVNLHGDFSRLKGTSGDWLVVPQRFESILRARTGQGIVSYAEESGFELEVGFMCRFRAFGLTLRDWVPADMVQNYPVYIFLRVPSPPPQNPAPHMP